jgi:hypothetical protein
MSATANTTACTHSGPLRIGLHTYAGTDTRVDRPRLIDEIAYALNHVTPAEGQDDAEAWQAQIDRVTACVERWQHATPQFRDGMVYVTESELADLRDVLTDAIDYMLTNGYDTDAEFPEDYACTRTFADGPGWALTCWPVRS